MIGCLETWPEVTEFTLHFVTFSFGLLVLVTFTFNKFFFSN